jgi:hypothetical protein
MFCRSTVTTPLSRARAAASKARRLSHRLEGYPAASTPPVPAMTIGLPTVQDLSEMSLIYDGPARHVSEPLVRCLHGLTLSLVVTMIVNVVLPGMLLISAQAVTAETSVRIAACATGHLFEPGPIANGHHRQPTQAEIEARTRINGGSC